MKNLILSLSTLIVVVVFLAYSQILFPRTQSAEAVVGKASMPLLPITFAVDRTDDVAGAMACTAAANDCSLRGAIRKSNATVGADEMIIDLQAGATYNLALSNSTQENAAATGDLDFVMPEKFEVIGFTCIKRNGAGAANTMQLKKAAAVISDAVACAVDNAVTNAASIDDAAGVNVFAAGETLRITATRAAGTRDALCIVRGYIRP